MAIFPLLAATLAAGSVLAAPSSSPSSSQPLEKLDGCLFADASCASEVDFTSACCQASNCHYDRHPASRTCVPVVSSPSSFAPNNCWVVDSSSSLVDFGTRPPADVYTHARRQDGERGPGLSSSVWDDWAMKQVEFSALEVNNFSEDSARTYAQATAERYAEELSKERGGRYEGPEWVQVATFDVPDCSSIPDGSKMTGSLRIMVQREDRGMDIGGSVKGMLGSLAAILQPF